MKTRLIALLAGVLALAACGDDAPQNPELLKGKDFFATINGVDATLSFDADEMRVYGKVVNRYSGSYEAAGNRITFGPFISTMMMGLPGAMQVENTYHQFMSTAQTYKLKGGLLTIKNAEGNEIFFKPLESAAE